MMSPLAFALAGVAALIATRRSGLGRAGGALGLISGIVVISIVAWLALAFALAPLGRDILRADASDG